MLIPLGSSQHLVHEGQGEQDLSGQEAIGGSGSGQPREGGIRVNHAKYLFSVARDAERAMGSRIGFWTGR